MTKLQSLLLKINTLKNITVLRPKKQLILLYLPFLHHRIYVKDLHLDIKLETLKIIRKNECKNA